MSYGPAPAEPNQAIPPLPSGHPLWEAFEEMVMAGFANVSVLTPEGFHDHGYVLWQFFIAGSVALTADKSFMTAAGD